MMAARTLPKFLRVVLLAANWLAFSTALALGQSTTGPTALVPPPPSPSPQQEAGAGPIISDSNVGYIDNAIIGTYFRLRYDAGYANRRPNRAEFFYAKGAPAGPGLPLPEASIDYQDLPVYLEVAATERLSGFVEIGPRLLNPDINANSAGLADMNAGFKWAAVLQPDFVATFQLRTYIPSGDASRGLGTDHISLEPALLIYSRLDPNWSLASELRYWIPIDGTDFAGDVIRYGIGLSYDLNPAGSTRISPVAEFVGWSVLGGKESFIGPGGFVVQGAAGDTILSAKLGVRVRFESNNDFYIGYGRPLTGDRWYENTFRVEYRLCF